MSSYTKPKRRHIPEYIVYLRNSGKHFYSKTMKLTMNLLIFNILAEFTTVFET